MVGSLIGSQGVIVGSAVGSSGGDEGGEAFTVWMFGQSNSLPRALATSITNRFGYGTAYPNVTLFRRSAPNPADPPVFTNEGPYAVQPDATAMIGPETSLARYLDDVLPRGCKILVGPSIGGAGLNDTFQNPAYPTTPPSLMNQVLAFGLASPVGRPDVLVLMQGETDAGDATDAAAFETNLTNEINAVRAVFPGIPVILGELSDSHAYPNQATVRTAMVNVAGALPNVVIVDTDGLALNGPDHYTGDSFVIVGERIGVAALQAIGQPRVRWTSAVTGGSGLEVTFTLDVSGGAPAASVLWDFGDGTTSTATNPAHTFPTNGRYAVTCRVTSANGRTHSLTRPRVAVNPSGRWAVDATSGKARPVSSTELGNLATDGGLLHGQADHAYLLQEASGNAADVRGTKNLTVGNAPLFQQAVAGWSSFFITGSGAATTQSHVNATMPNTNAARVAALAYGTWNASGAANRALMNRGAAGHVEITSSGGTAKARVAGSGATARITAADHSGAVHCYYIYSDPAGRLFMASEIEPPVEITWNSFSATDFRLTYSLSSDVAAINKWNFAEVWDAVPTAVTFDEVRCLLEAHGWDCSW